MIRFARIATLALPLIAAAPAADPHHSRPKNPNDLICKDTPMSGSRLDAKTVCMTRLQWEERRRDARETIEKAQRQQVNGHP
jgi:hypothetical protein